MITKYDFPQQHPKCCQKIVNEHSKCAYEQRKRKSCSHFYISYQIKVDILK